MRLGWHCKSILETLPRRWTYNKSARRLVKLGLAAWDEPGDTPAEALASYIHGRMLRLTDKGKEYLNTQL